MLVLPYAVMAQGRAPQPKEVLTSMQDALKGLGTADFEFSFQAFGQDGAVLGDERGHFVAQGEAFKLSTGSVTVFCDGQVKWIYDMVNEEVTIFPHDVTSVDPAENPFAVLEKADASMYSFKGGTENGKAEDGRALYTIDMVPKDKKLSFTSFCDVYEPDGGQIRVADNLCQFCGDEAVGLFCALAGTDGQPRYLYYGHALMATVARHSQTLLL